jgi:predicted SnoaL-like aldol condensation-catalyzing enzyme
VNDYTERVIELLKAFETGDTRPLSFISPAKYYDFGEPMVGFDIFRFENGLIVEHWDNLQRAASKPRHSMVDGPRTASDPDNTGGNKVLLKSYMDEIFVQKRRDRFASYFDGNNYDGVHMILGEGDFVLVVNDGKFGGKPTAIYDMYRVPDGKIAEHWDTLEAIPPRDAWKNDNGKF